MVLLLPDYVTPPSEVNITFKAPAYYIVLEGNTTELVLEVQGESAEDIMVNVMFTTITAESEWSVFLHGNMLCSLMFPLDFVLRIGLLPFICCR